jgi:exosortase
MFGGNDLAELEITQELEKIKSDIRGPGWAAGKCKCVHTYQYSLAESRSSKDIIKFKIMIEKLPEDGPAVSIHRNAYFVWTGYLLLCVLPAFFFGDLLKYLIEKILGNETYSHIPLVPLVTIFLIYAERRTIFFWRTPGWKIAATMTFAGAAILALTRWNVWHWNGDNQVSLLVLGLILLWTGAFGIFFGEDALRKAFFPLAFLAFAIPLPPQLFSEFIGMLQRRSADAVGVAFRVTGIPFARHGFDFALPGVTIEVAEECSGIRSTLALFMTAAIAGHLWLRSFPRTLLLCITMIPIAIAKNALRITLLSWLAVYVNRSFLYGSLHRYGGIPFFGLGLMMMGLVLLLLQSVPYRISMQSEE